MELIGFCILVLGIWFFLTPSRAWVERIYSQKIYPFIASLWVPLFDKIPFSVSGLLLILLPPALMILIFFSFKGQKFWQGLRLTFWRLLSSALVIAVLFLVTWGANYQRQSVETQASLQETPITQADLEELVAALTTVVQQTVTAERNEAVAMASIISSVEANAERLTTVKPSLPSKVKRVPDGSLILLGRASGVISPWTLEPHVDGAMPSISYLSIGAHELAHVAGYAGEADADFISALSGLTADDAFARYAVALRFWQNAARQLPSDIRESFSSQLPEQAKDDLIAMIEPFRTYQMPNFVQRIQEQSYNNYLKSQGVSSGIKDYSRSIDLLIQAQKQGLILSTETAALTTQ